MKILHIVGARPNFVKIAPIMAEIARFPETFEQGLVHTGQHYDEKLSRVFFEDLGIPRPDIDLNVGSGSHAQQTGRIILAIEPVLEAERPDLMVVVGDVNSTIATALVASKLWIPVAHVEAGLRSFNRKMPEEINRILTDSIASLLFTTDRAANENLRREGVAEERIFFVGNVMIDTLLRHRAAALKLRTLDECGLKPGGYTLLTLHRPSNVDDPQVLSGIITALEAIAPHLPVIFPIHPRTSARLEAFGLADRLRNVPGLKLVEPIGYLPFLNLTANAALVLTDSGGVQEETTILSVPCLTLREETERPVTVTEGTNLVIGCEPERIIAESRRILAGERKGGRAPELWDGKAAQRIVEVLRKVNEDRSLLE